MLTKKRGSRRLRWGVVALTALVPFTLPVAASAAQGPTATGESIQYVNVTVNPPAGAQTSTYDNSVYAANATNWHSPFKFTYKLRNSNAPIISRRQLCPGRRKQLQPLQCYRDRFPGGAGIKADARQAHRD